MAHGTVLAAAGDHRDDKQHDQGENDDAGHFHPARHAGIFGGFAGLGRGGRVSHERHFTRQYVLIPAKCHQHAEPYTWSVPKLWNETIEAHRAAVRDAIIETTAALVGEHGLASVTMSQIAEVTGIGRATLYKYFPDVEAILDAWHEREISAHLAQLAEARDRVGADGGGAGARLEAVLEAFALIAHEHHGAGYHDSGHEGGGQHGAVHHGAELGALLHRDRGEHVARARQQLTTFIRDLLVEGAKDGELRDDVAAGELATYCLYALTAASSLPSKAAVRRLVSVTLAGLRPVS